MVRPTRFRQTSLRRRLILLFGQWMVFFLVVAALTIRFTVSASRNHLAEHRLLLARTVAQYVDSTLSNALHDLERVSTDLPSLDEGARPRLRSYRLQSVFRDAIHLLDSQGTVLASEPPFAEPPKKAWLKGTPGIARLLSETKGRATLAAIQPFRRNGLDYTLVAESSAFGSSLSKLLQELALEPELSLVVVDSQARVIAAPDQKLLFQEVGPANLIGERILAHRPLVAEADSCSICLSRAAPRGRYVTILVPLRVASWGVVIQQSRSVAYSILRPLQIGLVTVTLLLAAMGFLLSTGLDRAVIRPILDLSGRAQSLRDGDLESPIDVSGDYEVTVLAKSLEAARRRIVDSLEELRRLNEDLAGLVRERTRELETRLEDLAFLRDASTLAAQERDLLVFVPRVLELFSRHVGSQPVALLVVAEDRPPKLYTHPIISPLVSLRQGGDPPPGWERRELLHVGRSEGTLYYPATAGSSRVLEPFANELAAALHHAFLTKRTIDQDSQRRVLLRRLLTAGEEERRRIARELHDEISQLLTVVQLSLESIGRDQERPEIERARELLRQTQREIHRIIFDLRPTLLDDLGLPVAVKWYAETYLTGQGVDVHLEVEEDLELPNEVEIATFRIYQEIVTNILRHAEADGVSIELYRGNGSMVLTVEDDGKGFDSAAQTEGSGLVGMRERALLVDGDLHIESSPGTGTTIRLTVPVAARETTV